MKKINISIIMLAACMFTFTGCENDGFYYRDVARVRLEGASMWTLGVGADSMSYNFVYAGLNTFEYEMAITLTIMGDPVDHYRTAKLAVIPSLTTARAEQYVLPVTVTIPANEYQVIFHVVLKRTSDLEENTVRLRFEVIESDDFLPGVMESSSLLVKWNDMIGMPNNWDEDLLSFFGSYSNTKYRFIIEQTGISDLSDLSWSERYFMQVKLYSALQVYNDRYGTLLDENGAPVTFPQ